MKNSVIWTCLYSCCQTWTLYNVLKWSGVTVCRKQTFSMSEWAHVKTQQEIHGKRVGMLMTTQTSNWHKIITITQISQEEEASTCCEQNGWCFKASFSLLWSFILLLYFIIWYCIIISLILHWFWISWIRHHFFVCFTNVFCVNLTKVCFPVFLSGDQAG